MATPSPQQAQSTKKMMQESNVSKFIATPAYRHVLVSCVARIPDRTAGKGSFQPNQKSCICQTQRSKTIADNQTLSGMLLGHQVQSFRVSPMICLDTISYIYMLCKNIFIYIFHTHTHAYIYIYTYMPQVLLSQKGDRLTV